MRRRAVDLQRAVAVALLAGIVLLASAPPTWAGSSPEQQLAEKYAPVAMLKVNDDLPCGRDGEQYRPAPVDVTLGNPTVNLLRESSRHGEKDAVIKTGATAQDIAGLGPSYYLNLRGDPESPGCTYAEDFAQLGQGAPAVTYAHVAREAGVRGIALQYWFYYYFNQFNDQHESDWEMIQLAFDTDSVDQALEQGPSRVAYAQHGGGERHGWGDPIVEKQGTHPVVYVASGSHASQFESSLYLGTGENGSGLGCDDTRGPSQATPLGPIVVPTNPTTSQNSAWLTYEGLWGQTARGFNNGITGPNMKRQWREPFRWMADLRRSTTTVPLGNTVGPSVTGFFCGAVAQVSGFLTTASRTPLTALAIILAVIVAVAVPARRTRWSPPNFRPLHRARAGGQIFRAGSRLYRQYFRTLGLIGLVALPLAATAVGLQELLFALTGLGAFVDEADTVIRILIAVFIGGIGRTIAYAPVAGAVLVGVRQSDRGEPMSVRKAFRGSLERFWALVGAQIAATLVVAALVVTIVGIPLAIKKAVDWTFVQHEIVFNGRSWRESFHASAAVVKGNWWRTLLIAGFILLIGVAAGPVLGVLLVFLTDTPLSVINAFGSLVFALMVPYMAVTRALLFFDLEARREGRRPEDEPALDEDGLAPEELREPGVVVAQLAARSPFWQWLLSVVTFGVWSVVWTYRTNRDLRDASRMDGRAIETAPALVTALALLYPLALLPSLVAAAFTALSARTAQRWWTGASSISPWLAALASFVLFLHVLYIQDRLRKTLTEESRGKSHR